MDSQILTVINLTLAGAWQHVFGPLPADLKERRGVTANKSEEQRFAEGVKLGFRRAEEALQPRKTRSSTSGIDTDSDHFRQYPTKGAQRRADEVASIATSISFSARHANAKQ